MIRFILFIMLVFALDSWGGCQTTNFEYRLGCYMGESSCKSNSSYLPSCGWASGSLYLATYTKFYRSDCCYTSEVICCATQQDADSVVCVLDDSKEWSNGQCVDAVDRCAVYHQQCLQLGGVFTGRQTSTGCAASCNTCGNSANENIMDIKVRSCCSQGLAPSVDEMCFTPDLAMGDGMQVSTNANLDCVDPNLDDDNLNLYVTYCYDQDVSSSSVESSADAASSGGGGSSGEDVNSSGGGVPGGQIDYYPILDTIRDTLINIKRNVNTIATCLLTPGACAGLNPQVNISLPSDSGYIKQVNNSINFQTDLLDSSLRNGNERMRNSIAVANDSLIDSLRKFLGDVSLGFSGDTLGDSLGRLHRTLEEFKAMFEAGQIDTSGLGAEYGAYISRGEFIGDSIVGSLGWYYLDTMNVDSIYSRALNGFNYDSVSSNVDDSLSVLAGSLGDSLARRTDSLRRNLPGVLDSLADSLVVWAPFADFDSIIYSTLGAHVPNRSECPEDCQKWTISIPLIGLYSYTVDFGLCLGRGSFGGMSVLAFVKLLIRLVVAYICIMTAYRVLVRMI